MNITNWILYFAILGKCYMGENGLLYSSVDINYTNLFKIFWDDFNWEFRFVQTTSKAANLL